MNGKSIENKEYSISDGRAKETVFPDGQRHVVFERQSDWTDEWTKWGEIHLEADGDIRSVSASQGGANTLETMAELFVGRRQWEAIDHRIAPDSGVDDHGVQYGGTVSVSRPPGKGCLGLLFSAFVK